MATVPSDRVPLLTALRPVIALYFFLTFVTPRTTGPRYFPLASTICTVEFLTLEAGIFTENFPSAAGVAAYVVPPAVMTSALPTVVEKRPDTVAVAAASAGPAVTPSPATPVTSAPTRNFFTTMTSP